MGGLCSKEAVLDAPPPAAPVYAHAFAPVRTLQKASSQSLRDLIALAPKNEGASPVISRTESNAKPVKAATNNNVVGAIEKTAPPVVVIALLGKSYSTAGAPTHHRRDTGCGAQEISSMPQRVLRGARDRRVAVLTHVRRRRGRGRLAAPPRRHVRAIGQDRAGHVQQRVQGARPGDGQDHGAEARAVREHGRASSGRHCRLPEETTGAHQPEEHQPPLQVAGGQRAELPHRAAGRGARRRCRPPVSGPRGTGTTTRRCRARPAPSGCRT